jgi:hypothetical protein
VLVIGTALAIHVQTLVRPAPGCPDARAARLLAASAPVARLEG